jgi:membrane-associated phospholipid phosphatase
LRLSIFLLNFGILKKLTMMKQLFIDNRYFLLPYLIFLAAFVVFSFTFTKIEMHIWANQIHSPFLDNFFKYATHLGDGSLIAILTIIFLFVKYRYALAFLAGSLLTSGIVHLFKQLLLKEVYRPSKYFELYETYQLYLVEGVTLRSLQSFPSGHTSTAFNVFLMLALISKNPYLKFGYFLLAALVAYSRVYLSQHFFVDIIAGSLIATVIMLLVYYWAKTWNLKWMESSVLTKAYTTK